MKRKFAIVGLIVALLAAVSLAGGWAAPFTLGSMNIATAAAGMRPMNGAPVGGNADNQRINWNGSTSGS